MKKALLRAFSSSGWTGSNRRHSAWKADALPTELHPRDRGHRSTRRHKVRSLEPCLRQHLFAGRRRNSVTGDSPVWRRVVNVHVALRERDGDPRLVELLLHRACHLPVARPVPAYGYSPQTGAVWKPAMGATGVRFGGFVPARGVDNLHRAASPAPESHRPTALGGPEGGSV